MQLTRDSIASLLSCVACIQQFHQVNKNYPLNKPVAIKKTSTHVQGWAAGLQVNQTLHTVVQSIVGKEIDIVEFDDTTAPAVDGMCLEFSDKAIIFVNKSLNFCWRRFIVAKELAHLLMNHQNGSLRSTNRDAVLQTIDDLIKKKISPVASLATIAEIDAYAGAVEMLFAKDVVEHFTGSDAKHIADAIKVPANIINVRTTDENTMDMHQQVYDDSRYTNAILHERAKRAN